LHGNKIVKLYKVTIRSNDFTKYFLFSISGCLLLISGCGVSNQSKTLTQNCSDLQKVLKRGLKGGENHLYIIHVKAGGLLHVQVMQQNVDVMAKLYSADKQFAA